MPMMDFSDKDILRSKLIEPAWYRVRIDNIGEAPSKDGQSTNYPVEATVLFNADTKGKDFEGCPVPYWNFNSKAKGFAVGFFKALGIDVESGKRYSFDACIGKTLDIFIDNEMFEGRPVNRFNHKYRTPKD